MMHRLCYIFIAAFAWLLAGCTHNNGDIGLYFGTWKLLSIEADGEAVSDYDGNIFWQFQSEVFCMREVFPTHDTDVRWGSWEERPDKVLVLNFTHHDDDHESGATLYSPLPVTGLSASVNNLDIVSQSGSKMTLTYRNQSGTSYRYRLEKW